MLPKVEVLLQSISKVSTDSPKACLTALATEGLAINKEVPESTMAESRGITEFPT